MPYFQAVLLRKPSKTGEITIGEDLIMTNSDRIPLEMIKIIEMDARHFAGARSSDGSGNNIRITNYSSETFAYDFVIGSKQQRNNLREILKNWTAFKGEIVLNGSTLYREA